MELGASLTAAGEAIADLGAALGSTPPRLTHSVFDDILRTQGGLSARVEAVIGAIVDMGWLNIVQDTLGTDMERPLTDEVEGVLLPLRWSTAHHHVAPRASQLQVPAGGLATPRRSDGLASLLEVVSCVPSAMTYELRIMSNVPSSPEDLTAYLTARSASHFTRSRASPPRARVAPLRLPCTTTP